MSGWDCLYIVGWHFKLTLPGLQLARELQDRLWNYSGDRGVYLDEG